MKAYSKIVLLISLFVAGSFSIHAQETGGVKGKIRTTNSSGIAAATVTARQNGEDVKSVASDADGNFVLDGLKTGNYNLVFSKSGYGSGVLYNVEVKKKKTRDLGERLVLTVDQGTQVIIKGSVFAPDGRSVGGAEIRIERISSDGSVKKVGSSVASYSGEFTFRFAEEAAKYRVTASVKGSTASKEIEVDGAAIYRLAITLNARKEN
jgi:hypothetical protein